MAQPNLSALLNALDKYREPTYTAGRRCSATDSLTGERCVTILNIYNVGPKCLCHGGGAKAPMPLTEVEVRKNDEMLVSV